MPKGRAARHTVSMKLVTVSCIALVLNASGLALVYLASATCETALPALPGILPFVLWWALTMLGFFLILVGTLPFLVALHRHVHDRRGGKRE